MEPDHKEVEQEQAGHGQVMHVRFLLFGQLSKQMFQGGMAESSNLHQPNVDKTWKQ